MRRCQAWWVLTELARLGYDATIVGQPFEGHIVVAKKGSQELARWLKWSEAHDWIKRKGQEART